MRRRFWIGLGVVLLLLSAPLRAAGTVTLVGSASGADVGGGMLRFVYDWTSDGSGNVSGNTTTIALKAGRIIQVEFVPNAGGTQPTDDYDAQLLTGRSIDLLGGMGANLSNTPGDRLEPDEWVDNGETLQLVISGAGAAKGGRVSIWVEPRR